MSPQFTYLLSLALITPLLLASPSPPTTPNISSSLSLKPLRHTNRRGRGGGGGSGRGGRGGRGGLGGPSGGSSDAECFPAAAIVHEATRGAIRMRDVRIGDQLQTSTGQYSAVYTQSHRETTGMYEYVKVSTESGNVTLSGGHYIYVGGVLKSGDHVRVGDELERGMSGKGEVVVRVENVLAEGLYNPHTLAGELVVDGFRVSCYTRHVHVFAANCLLAPVRALYTLSGLDFAGAWMDGSLRRLLPFVPTGTSVMAV